MVSQLTFILEVQGSKPYLHPSICTQVLLGPRLTFKCLCNVRTSHVHMLNLTSNLSFPDSHLSHIYNILVYTCDYYPFHTCTLHLLVFVCSTRFSHRCRKSSRQRASSLQGKPKFVPSSHALLSCGVCSNKLLPINFHARKSQCFIAWFTLCNVFCFYVYRCHCALMDSRSPWHCSSKDISLCRLSTIHIANVVQDQNTKLLCFTHSKIMPLSLLVSIVGMLHWAHVFPLTRVPTPHRGHIVILYFCLPRY